MNKLLNSNISTLHKVYKDRIKCPSEVIKACLDRIEETKPLNAYITVTKELAQKQAEASDKRYQNGKSLGPLDGVPISIKDNICTEGIRTTCASKMLGNFISPYNATVYQRLIDEGAILMGKTNMDEFAMGSGCVHSVVGPTHNAHQDHPEDFKIAGGSSGGAAVSVASNTCFAAIGSDTGGSVRNPASFNGLVGLKPTYGLISRHGLIPLAHSMDCVGVLGRSVSDVAITLNAIAGPDTKDSTNYKRKFNKLKLTKLKSLKGLKVGIPIEYKVASLTNEICNMWEDVANMMEEHGATIIDVSLPLTKYTFCCYMVLNSCEVSSNMASYDGIEYGYRAPNAEESTEKLYSVSRSFAFNEVVKKRIMTGNFLLLKEHYDRLFLKAQKVRRLIRQDYDLAFEKVNLLLAPVTISPALGYKEFMSMDDQDQTAAHDYCTTGANLAGIPAVSLPIKLSESGLPLGLQLMGPNLCENSLLCISRYVENLVKYPR